MNMRQQKTAMWVATAVLAVCAAGIVAAGLVMPVDVTVDSPKAPRPGVAVATSQPAAGTANNPSVSASSPASGGPKFFARLSQLCAKDLRKPLFDPQPKLVNGTPGRRPNASSLHSMRLIGTANEPGHSMAVFRKPTGEIEVCREGQGFKLQGNQVTVVAVDPNKVAVQYAGRRHELFMPKKP